MGVMKVAGVLALAGVASAVDGGIYSTNWTTIVRG
jgi:hypothetical protein